MKRHDTRGFDSDTVKHINETMHETFLRMHPDLSLDNLLKLKRSVAQAQANECREAFDSFKHCTKADSTLSECGPVFDAMWHCVAKHLPQYHDAVSSSTSERAPQKS
ncbi:Uncharacterized protein PBTT_04936 [Plasmodiophora brassicae]|uniref:Uncharacterized protein n=1 Tax=Plasmodiophora brassicae TaxID=37360 RepID=A0A0G4IRP3_PLABS|nr:hypothetical protein PBRA_005933 [Plasmodiophora brassicae]SPQ98367.1 unnamed protein product [Plasmodiophora brassicae]